jgi:hypothetical protein
MKSFIQWVYFPFEKVGEFVKNQTNNENWPTVNKFKKTLEEFKKKIDKQREVINLYREWKKDQKKGDEYFLIRIKNKIKKLQQEGKREGWDKEVIKYFSAGLELKNYEDLNLWYERGDYKLPEIKNLLAEWKEDKKKEPGEEFEDSEEIRSFRVEILGRTNEELFFIWNLPEDTLFSLIPNYLFSFGGEYYEVVSWEQTDYRTAEIIATKSVFYNYYWFLAKCQINGILHHSPLARNEICSCAEYNVATNYYSFGYTYQLRKLIYRNNSWETLNKNIHFIEEEGLPMIVPLPFEEFGVEAAKERFKEGLKDLTKDNQEKGIGGNAWEMVRGVVKTSEEIFSWITTIGIGSVMVLLSERYKGKNFTKKEFSGSEEFGNCKWRRVEKSGETKAPVGETIEELLGKWGLLEENMEHFLKNHITATLFWRQKQIWQGNYYLIHNTFKITEISTASGDNISIFGSNLLLNRVTELIKVKMGGMGGKIGEAFKWFTTLTEPTQENNEEKGQNIRQVERTVETETSINGGKAKKKLEKIKISEKDPNGTKKDNDEQRMGDKRQHFPTLWSIDHIKTEYNFYQFFSRWLLSGFYPISLMIGFNQNLFNQYRNRQELKGKPAYDYFNIKLLGDLLTHKGFFQASVISWNLNIPAFAENWFREKVEEGVYLYEENSNEFYEKKLTKTLNIPSFGGISTGRLSSTYYTEEFSSSIAYDHQVHVDGMSWIWKDSYLYAQDEPEKNLIPDLIEKGKQWIKKESLFFKIKNLEEDEMVDYNFAIEKNDRRIKIDRETGRKYISGRINLEHREIVNEKYKKDLILIDDVKFTSELKDENKFGAWKFDGQAQWEGSLDLRSDVFYNWYLHAFSTGERDKKEFRALDEKGIKVFISQDKKKWEIKFYGNLEVRETAGSVEDDVPEFHLPYDSLLPFGGTGLEPFEPREIDNVKPEYENPEITETDNSGGGLEYLPELEEEWEEEAEDEFEEEIEAEEEEEKQIEEEPEPEQEQEEYEEEEEYEPE